MDNIFIDSLWRSLKYEAVNLHDLTNDLRAERIIGEWIDIHDTVRAHSALAGRTSAEIYNRSRISGFWQHDQATD